MTDAPSEPPAAAQRLLADSITDCEELGRRLLEAVPGRVVLVGGIGTLEARACLDPLDAVDGGPLVLLVPLQRIAPADALIEDLGRQLARVALRCWPIWYGDVDFSGVKRDARTRGSMRAKLAAVAADWPKLSLEWARAAVALAQDHRLPRPARVHWSIEIIQLCLAIHPHGLVIVLDAKALPAAAEAQALVHALELVAGKAGVAVVMLCASLPEFTPPYDRILSDAVMVPALPVTARPYWFDDEPDREIGSLVPVSGRPHPLSEVEKRVASAIAASPDLAALFHCNKVVPTVRGSRPKVDLLWPEGRLVVELDGYSDHSRHDIFVGDRHRDYELTLSGYTVLRLANDEIHYDVEKAIDKIRDVVAYLSRRQRRSI